MAMPAACLAALLALATPAADAQPDATAQFEKFCTGVFGAQKEPLVYTAFGAELKLLDEGLWVHASERSACIAFETNLPARAHVDYGPTTDYGTSTPEAARHHYLHLHHLAGLKPGTQYHYRIVATDERGRRVAGPDATLSTRPMPDAIRIPGGIEGPPYILAKSGATYLVTQDLTIEGMAFDVPKSTRDVTLDLGGHTVVYDNRRWGPIPSGNFWDWIHKAQYGVRAMKATGLKILNGTLRQGQGNDAAQANSIGYNPIYANGCTGLEVAGLGVVYAGPQQIGIYNHWPGPDAHVHHNIFRDLGTAIVNRHGAGSRALLLAGSKSLRARVHHNLVARTRQSGLGGNQIRHNEVWIDSWATNSFGITPSDGCTAQGNRVLGGGYHVCGFGWANGITLRGNLVHLHGRKPTDRSGEYGDHESINGIRLTQYSGSKRPYEGNTYEGNLIIVQGSGGCQMRGVQFFSDPHVKNLVFRNNTVKAVALDGQTRQAACVVTQGLHGRTAQHLPILYEGNTFISNILNVRFGDYYGVGSNHRFVRCTFVRIGTDPRYHTFLFEIGYPCKNHAIRDCTFQAGASPDSVKWVNATADHDYAVQWTLTVNTLPGAGVVVRDRSGRKVFSGDADEEGHLAVPIAQYTAKATGKIVHTPHTVSATRDGGTTDVQVTVDRAKTVTVKP